MNLFSLACLLAPSAFAQLGGAGLVPPSLTGGNGGPPTLNEVSRATAEGNQVIQSMVTARGSDPSTWAVPIQAVIPPQLVPAQPIPHDYRKRMAELVRERDRLANVIRAECGEQMWGGLGALAGLYNSAAARKGTDQVVHPGAPTIPVAKEFEGVAETSKASIVSYLAVLNMIDEMKHSGAWAQARYEASMKELGVIVPTRPKLPTEATIAEKQSNMWPREGPSFAPSRPSSSDLPVATERTLKNCDPIVEDSVDYISVPVYSYTDNEGKMYYNHVWKRLTKRIVGYPPGC